MFELSTVCFISMRNMDTRNKGNFFLVLKDPIDCVSDPCHLAWLIRDNRNLLKVVDGATCSNGTGFEELDPDGFQNCPVPNFLFFLH